MHSKSENATKSSQVKEAGIASTSSHQIEEPPLQHRRIVSYDRNHNIIKTNTTEWCNEISEKNEERNPILEYDAAVQNSRKQDEKSTKKVSSLVYLLSHLKVFRAWPSPKPRSCQQKILFST